MRRNIISICRTETRRHGFSENYIKVKTTFNPHLVNKIVKVKLETIVEDGYLADVIS
jgi:hypothetical protein